MFGQAKLKIAGRDRTKLLDGLDPRVAGYAQRYSEVITRTSPSKESCASPDRPAALANAEDGGHLLAYRKALAKRRNAAGRL